jgi:phospholipase A1
MHSHRFIGVRARGPAAKGLAIWGVLLGGLATAGIGQADSMTDCMTRMMQHSDDGVTLGALRQSCREQLGDAAAAPAQGEMSEQAEMPEQAAMPEPVLSERMRQDKENVLRPFTLMAHKPNYMLIAAYNSRGYDAEFYQEQFDDPTIEFDDTEAQFQISIKAPLAIDLFGVMDVYGAYTNRSFWQVYNSNSAPFRETNHEPEIWAEFTPGWEFLGFTNTKNALGLVHQSNGRGGTLSRSWNRAYANFIVERDNLALSFKPWYRFEEDADDDDNPDITDYLGHYELRAAYKWNKHVFSAMSRNNLESGFSKGAVELGWSFPLGNYPYLKGYMQFFNGYGESLIDYNKYVNRIGIGIALTDWL